jgi:hypothetical protein
MGEEVSYSDRHSKVLLTQQLHIHPSVAYKGISALVIPEFHLYKHISSRGKVDFISSIVVSLVSNWVPSQVATFRASFTVRCLNHFTRVEQ